MIWGRKTPSYGNFIHPFDGWPLTVPMANGWMIYARYLTARRAEYTVGLKAVCKALALFFAVMAAIVHEDRNAMMLMIGIAAGFGLLSWKMADLLCKRTNIEMQRQTLKIGRRKRYDLTLPHQFDMVPHPKRTPLEFRNRTPKGIPVYSFYDNTWLIRMHYAGNPVPLLEVYNDHDASLIVARLQSVDQVLQDVPKKARASYEEGD